MHTAEWNSSVELRGKRVAVVGTGASGVQVRGREGGRAGGREGCEYFIGVVSRPGAWEERQAMRDTWLKDLGGEEGGRERGRQGKG
jgi:hypothetical protein